MLTSRIAYLILEHSIPASSICAVTFTNKAANEMKERLKKMIGDDQTNMLKMGTFHAFCVPFLRKHAKSISIQSNFTICDAAERWCRIYAPHLARTESFDIQSKDYYEAPEVLC